MRALLFLFLLLGLTGCDPRTGPTKFSSVSEGGFSPEARFREQGYGVKGGPSGGVSDPVALERWYSWQGVLTVPKSTNACAAVADVIRDALKKAVGGTCRDELTPRIGLSTLGTSGQLLYHKDGMQGEVHVWLFSASSEAEVSYAIFLREERANLGPSKGPAPRWKFWKGNWRGTP